MNCYQILKVSTGASPKEIEEAYQRLLKEARYNSSIDRQRIDAAYRILSDQKKKERYDQQNSIDEYLKKKKLEKKKLKTLSAKLTLPRLIQILAILFLVAIGYYYFRFGDYLKTFQAGQTVYYKDTNQKYGRILRVESGHDFGVAKVDAYLIETIDKTQVWVPQTDVQSRCYAP